MHKPLLNACCVLLPFVCAGPALASLATYEISATVLEVYDPGNRLQGGIYVGQIIDGSYTFDLSTPDEEPSPEYGRYNQSGAPGFELMINQETIRSDNTVQGHMNYIYTGNSTYSDYFHIGTWGGATPLTNGVTFSDINLDLYDPNGYAMNSSALSATPPSLNAFVYKDLWLWGSDGMGNYVQVRAKIDTLTGSQSACGPQPETVTFNVKAIVRDVYDPAGALNGSVNVGQTIEGVYTFKTTIPDEEPAAEIGRYFHRPGSGQYGFDLTLAGHHFKTDVNRSEFVLDLYNGNPNPDHYAAFSYGANQALANGATVENIGLHLFDESGMMLSSTALSANPPTVPDSTYNYNEVYISGMHPNGMDWYSIWAQVQSIAVGDTPSIVAISPASGTFDRAQRFDLAMIFPADMPPMMERRLNINGSDQSWTLLNCYPGAPNNQNRFTLVCPDYFQNLATQLSPGKNRLDFEFIMGDGTVVNESVEWEILGF